MKVNIRPEMCKFYVNREKRKVVCVLEGTEQMASDFMCDQGLNTDFMFKDWSGDLCLPNRFVGIATCAEGDTWDEEFGKQLAFHKMKVAFYTAFSNHATQYFNNIYQAIDEVIRNVNNFGDKVNANLTRSEERIEEYLKGTPQ